MAAAERVVVRGGGELASAAARLLFLSGFPVVVLEREAPLAVRRQVCFAEAVFAGQTLVEGVEGRRVAPADLPSALASLVYVPVVVDPQAECVPALSPAVLVDGRMAKRNLGTRRDQAPLVIGLGPGFEAGLDVHAVVETQRGPDMGRVYWSGEAAADTAVPAPVLGHTEARVIRAATAGPFRPSRDIGQIVAEGDVVGEVAGVPVRAGVEGLIRGLLAHGVVVESGTKLGDIDPRGGQVDAARLSDKARAVAAGVLEAVLRGRLRG